MADGDDSMEISGQGDGGGADGPPPLHHRVDPTVDSAWFGVREQAIHHGIRLSTVFLILLFAAALTGYLLLNPG